jgi:hypothetical protein
MRKNAAERGLVLGSAHGSIEVVTNQSWEMQRLQVRFEARLDSGRPSADVVSHIIDRMQHCPVSVNLRSVTDSGTAVVFVQGRQGQNPPRWRNPRAWARREPRRLR